MIAINLTNFVNDSNPFKNPEDSIPFRELKALKEIVEICNGFKQCPWCGVHREEGWMENHEKKCKLWKQLVIVLD